MNTFPFPCLLSLRRYLSLRQARLAQETFDLAYDWAAGQLLRGRYTPSQLRSFVQNAPRQEVWDLGVLAACDKAVSVPLTQTPIPSRDFAQPLQPE